MKLGRYEVKGEIARGAAGVVYRAHDPTLQRDVAIKVLQGAEAASQQARRRFAREARALARLSHPNVLRLHAAEVGEPVPFLVLDLIEGETLADRLERDGPLPVPEAARIGQKLAEGLAHCHAQGVLHRDLKPGNVLLTSTGEPLLADFGLVKDLQRAGETVALTDTGTVMGTPGYWSPEQAAGEVQTVDERTDVYSLGATLYALLTGSPPFWGATLMELAIATREQPAASLSDLRPETPADLDAVVQHCLAKAPTDRYGSAELLAADLERFLSGQQISGVGPGARAPRRGSTVAAGLGLVAVALGIGLWPLRGEQAVAEASATPTRPVASLKTAAPPAPTWGWRLPLGERVRLLAEAQIGTVDAHRLSFELELEAGEQLEGGRQRLTGQLTRISGVASGGETLLPFDTNRALSRHSTAVQLVLAGLFGEVGKSASIVLGPRFADVSVSGLHERLQLQRGHFLDVNQSLRRILAEPLGVLPVGPVAESWSATTDVEVDVADEVVFAGTAPLRGRRAGGVVNVVIETNALEATAAAARLGYTGRLRYRRTARVDVASGWVRAAESREEQRFATGSGSVLRRTLCRVRVRRLKRG